MERLILPLFAVFGFLGSLFFDGGESNLGRVTQSGKTQIEYD